MPGLFLLHHYTVNKVPDHIACPRTTQCD